MTKAKASEQQEPQGVPAERPEGFFIVNPAGCVHEVDEQYHAELIVQDGWRKATDREVAQRHQ